LLARKRRLSQEIQDVTIDKSLKRKGRLARSRNVLKRGERIDHMKSQDTWQEGMSPLGIPKTRVIKLVIGKKKKKTKEEDTATAEKGKGEKGKKK
jgi:small basic protein (TIGR04137 family)